VARRLNSHHVIETLGDAMLRHGVPEHVRSDNGAEMRADRVQKWLGTLGTRPLFIEPGSPWENRYCESFNGKLRQRQVAGRMLERGDLLLAERSPGRHRTVAGALQHAQAA
jgi:putative transposase